MTLALEAPAAGRRAVAHDLRRQVLTAIRDGAQSPTVIARQLDVRTENVSYHVRVLADLDVIELVETRAVRGALMHLYEIANTEAARTAVQALDDERDRELVRDDEDRELLRAALGALELVGDLDEDDEQRLDRMRDLLAVA